MTSKSYPENLLIDLLDEYDPCMNRLDPYISIEQRRRNRKLIQQKYVSLKWEIDSLLHILFAQLSERDRQIIHYRYVMQVTLKATGEIMHVSGERVRQLQSRVKTRLLSVNDKIQVNECPLKNVTLFFELLWPENAPHSVSPIMMQPISSKTWLKVFTQFDVRLENETTLLYAQKVYRRLMLMECGPLLQYVLHIQSDYDLAMIIDKYSL